MAKKLLSKIPSGNGPDVVRLKPLSDLGRGLSGEDSGISSQSAKSLGPDFIRSGSGQTTKTIYPDPVDTRIIFPNGDSLDSTQSIGRTSVKDADPDKEPIRIGDMDDMNYLESQYNAHMSGYEECYANNSFDGASIAGNKDQLETMLYASYFGNVISEKTGKSLVVPGFDENGPTFDMTNDPTGEMTSMLHQAIPQAGCGQEALRQGEMTFLQNINLKEYLQSQTSSSKRELSWDMMSKLEDIERMSSDEISEGMMRGF